MDWLISFMTALWLLLFPAGEAITPGEESMATTTAEVIQVVDGDTIRALVDGRVESIRYTGIDTPEPYRDGEPACFSGEASERNRQLVGGQLVTLVRDQLNRDKYDRLLRYVYVDEVFVNELLVREGYADTLPIPPNTTYASLLESAKQEAISQERGMWVACD